MDLRTALNWYEAATGKGLHGWSDEAGTLTAVNRVYDQRGLLQRQSVPHLLTLNTPGQFQAGDWASTSNPSVTTTYDALRRPLTRVQPDGLATFRWSYSGWSTTLVDENGHQKVQTSDVLGRLASVQDFTGTYPSASPFQTTGYQYDVADQLTGVTDATGQNKTSRVYDSLGRLTSQGDPDLGTWTYGYNPIGTRASLTDAKGQTISYTYDNLDRLTAKSGTSLSVSYTYDSGTNGIGRRTGMTDGAGSASYGYDARGRLTALTRVINGVNYALSTTYDEQDRVLTTAYPNGDVLAYWYGDHGLPETLILNGNVFLVKEATYTQLKQVSTLPLGNGLVTQYHYYALDTSPPNPNEWFGRLAQVVTGGVQNQSIGSYDGVGNPTGLSYTDHTSESFAAGYNEWDQLTAFGSLEGYGYIPAGQQYDIGTIQTKGASSYGYPAPGQPRPHAPTSVSGIGGYGYDANGNRASDATTTYTYDVENHLAQLTQGGTTVLQNTFDGDGVRLARLAGGVTTHFVGDWYEADPATGIATAYYPFNGQAVAMNVDGTLSYLHRDHLGSLVSATDTAGTELGWARYYPFGELRLGGGTLPSDRLFTGQIRDLGDDRRYWFKARAYDATVGQFQEPDVAVPDFSKGGQKDAQTLSRYAYGLNNPLRFIDPTGRVVLDPGDQSDRLGVVDTIAPSLTQAPSTASTPTPTVPARPGTSQPIAIPLHRVEPGGPAQEAFAARYGQQILAAADLYDLPPELVAAIVFVESGSPLEALRLLVRHFSTAHSLGIGNIHLARARLVSPRYIPAAANDADLAARLRDPSWNILYVAAILRQDADRPNRYPGVTNLTDEEMAILATEYQIGLRSSPASQAQPNAYGEEVDIQARHFRQIFSP